MDEKVKKNDMNKENIAILSKTDKGTSSTDQSRFRSKWSQSTGNLVYMKLY